jgi:hypothetical protein
VLGELAFAGKAQGQHQEQVDSDGVQHLLQQGELVGCGNSDLAAELPVRSIVAQ